MQDQERIKKYKKIIIITGGALALLFVALIIIINSYLEPVLRNRLHTLIIEGSDSLYTYKLGKLNADIFGGNVEIQDLEVTIDSNRYKLLEQRKALPALTIQVNMRQGQVRGIGIMSILFGKKVNIEEIVSKDADIRVSRYAKKDRRIEDDKQPLWKAIQPKIKSISIKKIQLSGIKLLYNDSDSTESAQLQFNRCDALLEDIKVDSLSTTDTSRIGFMKNIFFDFNNLKYQTKDSVYKMEAGKISYSSVERQLTVDSFQMQPTLNPKQVLAKDSIQRTLYYILFDKVLVRNIRIDQFIRNDIIEADSIIFQKPHLSLYLDKSLPKNYATKIGKYPHQNLLKLRSTIIVKSILATDFRLDYTEKNGSTRAEGKFSVSDATLSVNNITNDPDLIRKNAFCIAKADGKIFETSPISVGFKFYLDSTNGRFDATGSIKNISEAQVNPLSLPLANLEVRSLSVQQINFQMTGQDYYANANVQMLYKDVSVVFRGTNEETGDTETKKFLTNLFNKIINLQNPGPDGVERKAQNVYTARLTTQSFFGLIWKAVFAGMQDIMMKG